MAPRLAACPEEAMMPLYEYRCHDCGTAFELLLKSSSETPACTACASQRVEKLFSVFAVGGRGSSSATDSIPEGCRGCGDPRGPGGCGL